MERRSQARILFDPFKQPLRVSLPLLWLGAKTQSFYKIIGSP